MEQFDQRSTHTVDQIDLKFLLPFSTLPSWSVDRDVSESRYAVSASRVVHTHLWLLDKRRTDAAPLPGDLAPLWRSQSLHGPRGMADAAVAVRMRN